MNKFAKRILPVLCTGLVLGASTPYTFAEAPTADAHVSQYGEKIYGAHMESHVNLIPHTLDALLLKRDPRYVFDRNGHQVEVRLFEKIDCYREPGQIGRMIPHYSTVSSDRSTVEKHMNVNDGAGYLVFGPYGYYHKGLVHVSFNLRQDCGTDKGANSPVAKIDIYNATKGRVEAQKDIYRSELEDWRHKCDYKTFFLNFYNESEDDLIEFRIYCYGNAAIWTDYMNVYEEFRSNGPY